MKYFSLVWAGIWHKPGRTTLVIVSISNAFALFGLLLGFASGLESTASETRADVLMTYSRISRIEPLPMSHKAQIEALPEVRAVSPMVALPGYYQMPDRRLIAFAIDAERLASADPDLKIPSEQLSALKDSSSGMLVSATMAAANGWKAGERVSIQSYSWPNRDGSQAWTFDILAVYPNNPSDQLFGNAILIDYDQFDRSRFLGSGTSDTFLVRVNDPERSADVSSSIDALFANSAHETKTTTVKQLAQDQVKQIGDIGFVVRSIVGAVFFALLFSVGAVMMQSIRERTHAFGVLKTIGFTDGGVLAIILAESLVLCLFSAAIGLGIAALLFPLARMITGFSAQAPQLAAEGFAAAVVFGLSVGLLPALRAMRQPVADALMTR